jgi:murein DD-endopeptidase MepM/ murein hydrolase activator NlpD
VAEEPKESSPPASGYGNIYTPHAGSMIIQVQRESTLANRTIVLSQQQVRLVRAGLYAGAAAIIVGLVSWVFLATQAARVPALTRRLALLQHDARRIDTLQVALRELEGRFQQVQRMLGAGSERNGTGASPSGPPILDAVRDSAVGSVPSEWPLPVAGELLQDSTAPHRNSAGIDIGVPVGTAVRAAGAGTVVEISDDPPRRKLIRIAHGSDYESIYGNAGELRVVEGERVSAGAVIALTGGGAGTLPPHLHFEIRRKGVDVNASSLMKRGPTHGDLQ